MSTSQFAVIVGIALGVVAVFAGFVSFVIVLLFAAAGLVIGRMLEGKLDLKVAGRPVHRTALTPWHPPLRPCHAVQHRPAGDG